MPKDTLTITDNRTGRTYELPIENGCIRTMDLRQIKTNPKDFGLMGYDPAFLNTANCKSTITYIDGDAGILEYRGYPIEQLAEKSSFLEVAYLLINGELPTSSELNEFIHTVTHHTYVHENIKTFMDGFRYDAHPMSILGSTVAALSGFYPDAMNVKDPGCRRIQMIRMIAKMPTIAALYGPLHGGANEAALQMLRGIGSVEKVPEFIKQVKAGHGKLMGFGHRVYKNFDPRATVIKRIAYEVFDLTGKNPLLDIALEVERIALQDEYFMSRKLYPNVDFYSGLIYQSMGFPVEMFPVLFAIPRTAGWVTQWEEMIQDPEQKIARPRQIFLGPRQRDWVPPEKRSGKR